jgi:uncharacterized protein (TIGR02118 family)
MSALLKFIVVLHQRHDQSDAQFRDYLRNVHGPIAKRLPGLRKYVQNYPAADPTRKPPAWSAVIELYWDDWEAMEAAWKSPEGQRATADLEPFADLNLSSWAVVDAVE